MARLNLWCEQADDRKQLVHPTASIQIGSVHPLFDCPFILSLLSSLVHPFFSSFQLSPPQEGKKKKPQSSRPPEGSSHVCVGGGSPLRGPSERAQGLLQSLAVRLVPANHGLPLLVLLLVQEAQEVPQLRDGERIPLKDKKGQEARSMRCWHEGGRGGGRGGSP